MSKRTIYSIFFVIPLLLCFGVNNLAAQCPGNTTINVLEDRIGITNDIECFSFTGEGFQDIEIFSLAVQWDPEVLRFESCNAPKLPSFTCTATATPDRLERGVYTMLWFGSEPLNVPDNDTLITLCFEVIGGIGQSSLITPLATSNIFDDLGNLVIPATDIEIIKSGCPDPTNNTSVPATLTVGCRDLGVGKKSCPSSGAMNNGSITFEVCGGQAPYNYTIGTITGTVNDMETETVSGLAPGSYTIQIVDDLGVPFNEIGVVVPNGEPISFASPALVTNRPTCEAARPDGKIELFPIGGEPPYTYKWEATPASLNPLDGLGAGTYNVTVADRNGCEVTDRIILDYDPMTIVNVEILDAACAGNDGSLIITTNGGTPETSNGQERYRVQLDDDRPFRLNNPTPPIPRSSGQVRITVYDQSLPDLACFADTIVNIGIAKEFAVDLTSSNNDCTGGLVNVNTRLLTGSDPLSGDLTYRIFNAAGVEVDMLNTGDTNINFTNLAEGAYTVSVFDNSDNCNLQNLPITVEPNNGTGIPITPTFSNPGCGDLGTITVEGLPGDPSLYRFEWTDGVSIDGDNTRTDLMPDNYNVVVTDIASGCTGTFDDVVALRDASVILSETDGSLRIAPQEINCPGFANGVITVEVRDPVVRAGVTYAWYQENVLMPGETGETISSLEPGEYRVEINGGTVCPFEQTFTLSDPTPLEATITQEAIVCFGEFANITGTEVNGRTGLNYIWSDGLPDGQLQFDVPPGTYTLTVSDPVGGCSDDTTFVIQEFEELIVPQPTTTANDCFAQTNASASIDINDVMGGSARNRLFVWSDDPNNPDPNKTTVNNLPTGEHWVLAFDEDECISDTTFFLIDGGAEILIDQENSVFTEPSCFGNSDGQATIEVNGGSGNFDLYRLRNLETQELLPFFTNSITGLVAGQYAVQITDDASCGGVDTITITEPDSLILDIDINGLVPLGCSASNTGLIRTIYTGGNEGPISFSWSHDPTLISPVATNLGEGIYTAFVEDSNGCQDSTTYEMLAPEPITVDFDTIQFVQCFGRRLNFGGLVPSGGTNAGFRFSINNGSLMPVADSILLFAGMYDVAIFDQDGCSLDTVLTVIEPPEVVVELGPDVEINLGDSHQLSAEHDPEENIVLYQWTTTDPIDCLDCPRITVQPENDTMYGVRIENSDGCSDEDEVMIRVKRNRNVFIPNVVNTSKSNANSSFKLFSGQGVEQIEYLRIYDRWGNLVHEIEQLSGSLLGSAEWNARLNGNIVEAGVYVYVARVLFTDGEFLDYKGDITVIH